MTVGEMTRPATEVLLVQVTVVGFVALVYIEGLLCRVVFPTPGAVEEFHQSELWSSDWKVQPDYWQVEGHSAWIVSALVMSQSRMRCNCFLLGRS